jgi:catechol 2,3-dioxygenase-like lactoylglutathione lyase family enzyme
MGTSVPQHLSILTLGAFNLPLLRDFYEAWGWSELKQSSKEWCAFDMGGCLLSIYPLELLGDEAAPGEPVLAAPWRGFTMAISVESEEQVQDVFDTAVASGAIEVQEPTRRDWGGLSAYIADPEGNRWEIAAGGPHAAATTTE